MDAVGLMDSLKTKLLEFQITLAAFLQTEHKCFLNSLFQNDLLLIKVRLVQVKTWNTCKSSLFDHSAGSSTSRRSKALPTGISHNWFHILQLFLLRKTCQEDGSIVFFCRHEWAEGKQINNAGVSPLSWGGISTILKHSKTSPVGKYSQPIFMSRHSYIGLHSCRYKPRQT